MDIKDEEIVDGILKKDRYALTKLIDKYGSLIYNVVKSVLRESYEHESIYECVDDVLMCLWQNIDCFSREKGNFKWWLIAVTKNKALTYKRKIKKTGNDVDVESATVKALEDVEAQYLNSENRREIFSLLNNLDEKDKEIFVRRYFRGDDVKDISREFNISTISVYNRLSRGRRKLKKIIKEKNINFKFE